MADELVIINNLPSAIKIGEDSSDATATTADILLGKTAYVNGKKIIGTIISKESETYTPTTTSQIIESDQYISGDQIIEGDENLISNNIKAGITIFGIPGDNNVIDTTYTGETASTSNMLEGTVAFVNGQKIVGNCESMGDTIITPYVENQIITGPKILQGNKTLTVLGDANLLSANIKKGVSIFGVNGNYDGGEGDIKEGNLIDTSSFTSKQETVDSYGTSIYIMESSYTEGLTSLTDIVERWGGISANNNYIGESTQKYGINMSNWSEQSVNTGILFFTPIDLISGEMILALNCYCSNWMNITVNIHLISAIGDTEEEILNNIYSKIISSNYDLTQSLTYVGASSLTDVLAEIKNVVAGTYYIYIDGTVKGDNSSFSYVNVHYVNF